MLPLASTLQSAASATQRSIAAALLGCTAHGLDAEVVLAPLLALCQDTEGLVRRVACAQLPAVARRLPSAVACVVQEINSLMQVR